MRRVMDIPEGEAVVYVDLHDALTTLAAHGKHIPEGFDEDLLLTIDREAAKRMTALVAPQAHMEVGCPSQLLHLALCVGNLHSDLACANVTAGCPGLPWLLLVVTCGGAALFQWPPDMHSLSALTSTALRWPRQAVLPRADAGQSDSAYC